MADRSSFRRCAVPLVALLVIAAGCGDDDDATTATTAPETTDTTAAAPDGIVVGAGINDPDDATVAVLAFMPAQITVEVNTPVAWEWTGAEPHSVTFAAGEELPTPDAAEPFFEPTPPTGPYDGTTLVNSGLQPLGPSAPAPFELTFSAAGTYTYNCVIHPQMVGEVEVVEAGGAADTPADVAAARADEQEQWLQEGRDAKAALVEAEPAQVENPDGSTTWTVEMGAATAHTDILAFAPTPAEAKAGDTVTFVNSSTAPHTATFFGEGAEPIQSPLDPRAAAPAPGPSPQALSSSGLFNTGLLPPNVPPGAGPPEAVRSFSFTVPDPGTYSYVCLFHASSEMVGQITVS